MFLCDALLDAWALIMPVECAGCSAADRSLCRACSSALGPTVTPRTLAGGLTAYTALRYEGPVRRVILAFKENDRTDVAAALARPLHAAVHRALAGGPAEIAPVPTSRAAWRRRGYDPVRTLLRRAGLPTARVLRPVRRTRSQKTLGVGERAHNLRGSLESATPLHGRRFVIVDDVLTTGATILEAARAITAAGGEVVSVATLAFTPRLFPIRDNATDEDYGNAKGAQIDRLSAGGDGA